VRAFSKPWPPPRDGRQSKARRDHARAIAAKTFRPSPEAGQTGKSYSRLAAIAAGFFAERE
jgi:hypothetical protein